MVYKYIWTNVSGDEGDNNSNLVGKGGENHWFFMGKEINRYLSEDIEP